MTNSIAIIQKFGITRSEVDHVARTNFKIPGTYRQYFQSMHLLYWTGEHILKRMQNGVIKTLENDAGYHVVFIDGLTRGQIIGEIERSKESNKPAMQYGLSFRQAKPEFKIPALVLIRTARLSVISGSFIRVDVQA